MSEIFIRNAAYCAVLRAAPRVIDDLSVLQQSSAERFLVEFCRSMYPTLGSSVWEAANGLIDVLNIIHAVYSVDERLPEDKRRDLTCYFIERVKTLYLGRSGP